MGSRLELFSDQAYISKHRYESELSRREFLNQTAVFLGSLGFGLFSSHHWGKTADAGLSASDERIRNAPVARYWISADAADVSCTACHLPNSRGCSGQRVPKPGLGNEGGTQYNHKEKYVKCLLCARECLIKDGERGQCRARINVSGTLRSLVYGYPVTVHTDPIEKKPFYHFLPGASAFSLATSGCPLKCRFCQNWEISQSRPEDFPGDTFIPPEKIVRETVKSAAPVIAFTYNEPTVFTEYLTDIARISRRQNFRNVLISCGFMNPEPLTEMCSVLDAIKIDLKGFSKDFYRQVCDAELEPVLRSIRQIAKSGIHLEIVNLVVPTLNDSELMLTDLAAWIVGELGPDVPVHFTRFHPDYQMLNLPPTPVASLERAYQIAKAAGIRYPYIGNVPGHPGNHTHCPGCGKAVISRTGFFVTEKHLKEGRCGYCNERITGVWT